MPSYLVTGAGRGLGYGFLKQLVLNPENTVFGLTRDADAARDRLAADGLASRVHIVQAEITSHSSLQRTAKEVEVILGDKGLDVLINNAAYVSEVTAWKSLVDFEENQDLLINDLQKSVEVNIFGAMRVNYAFLPLIKKGSVKKVLSISSGMSDIDFINATKIPVATPYAISKAGLSTVTAKFNASYHDQGILFVALCPGNVDTAEGKQFSKEERHGMQAMGALVAPYAPDWKGPFTPEESAAVCLSRLGQLSLEKGHGGVFLSHNGTKKWM
ncbi:NAD(P)-binding protein [Aspergillus steynii IBT 23096]|uniref:NAD(P)-binding protein n=1 Tax=Aspergillus steynii IBT 23096 TaxID=1392250 RepID=A0A2I2GAI5_9EURO|nr:NAD(P)-binding protein [Aspergillus steynii IBT 23096]PLB49884.1 NAD(P)-binding protein [Aspergillus steynii IBT 23096]